jgi:hypothetical protein
MMVPVRILVVHYILQEHMFYIVNLMRTANNIYEYSCLAFTRLFAKRSWNPLFHSRPFAQCLSVNIYIYVSLYSSINLLYMKFYICTDHNIYILGRLYIWSSWFFCSRHWWQDDFLSCLMHGNFYILIDSSYNSLLFYFTIGCRCQYLSKPACGLESCIWCWCSLVLRQLSYP